MSAIARLLDLKPSALFDALINIDGCFSTHKILNTEGVGYKIAITKIKLHVLRFPLVLAKSHLAMDIITFGYMLPTIERVRDFHL
jgi:hypothetical protein